MVYNIVSRVWKISSYSSNTFFRRCGRYSSQGLNDNFALTTLSLELILEPLLVPIFSFNLAPEMFDIPPLSRPSFVETNSREMWNVYSWIRIEPCLWEMEFFFTKIQKKKKDRYSFLRNITNYYDQCKSNKFS